MFLADDQTEAIVMIGEIGGSAEEEAAAFCCAAQPEADCGLHRWSDCASRPPHGHAGAIVSGGSGAATDKIGAMEAAGFEMAESPADIGNAVTRAIAAQANCVDGLNLEREALDWST